MQIIFQFFLSKVHRFFFWPIELFFAVKAENSTKVRYLLVLLSAVRYLLVLQCSGGKKSKRAKNPMLLLLVSKYE